MTPGEIVVDRVSRRFLVSANAHRTLKDVFVSRGHAPATENPSRMNIPDEYVRTGRSMNRSSSANETISSIASRTCARDSPWIDPLR